MKISFLFFLIFSLSYLSCKQKDISNDSPIEEAKMISIMTDVYYWDAQFSELNSSIKDSVVFQKFNEILGKNGINMEVFRKAQTYYNLNEKAQLRLEEGIKKRVQSASTK